MTRTVSETMICVLYYRVSTEEQAKKGHSLPEQRALCRLKAAGLARLETSGVLADLQLVEFEDALGGDILERPVLTQVREYVREQKPAYFVCLDPDRFSRSLKWQLLVADEIEDRGTRLVFVQQDYDPDDMMSRAFFQFRGLMSELDKAKIKERTTRGVRGKLKQGQLSHGVPTYGYRYNKETDILEAVESEAAVVRQIFDWAAARMLPSEIRDRLNLMGVRPRKGKQWYSSTIQSMLRNETFVGRMWCNRYDTTGYTQLRQLPKALRKTTLTNKQRPRAEWILLTVPPLVEPDVFLQVHQTFRIYKRQSQKGKGMLSGLCRCGLCGGAINYVQHGPGNYNFRCVNRYPAGRDIAVRPPKCELRHTRTTIIEKHVWRELEQALLNPDALVKLRESHQATRANERKLEKTQRLLSGLQSQLGAKRKEQAVILAEKSKGYVDEEVYQMVMAELKGRIDALQVSIRQTQASIIALSEAAASGDHFRNYLVEIKRQIAEDDVLFRGKLANLNTAGRQRMARLLIQAVIIHPNHMYEIQWANPPAEYSAKQTSSPMCFELHGKIAKIMAQ